MSATTTTVKDYEGAVQIIGLTSQNKLKFREDLLKHVLSKVQILKRTPYTE